jgi:hypothetical protein
MKETTNGQQAESADQSIDWNVWVAAAIAGATGALLAVLVCVPYDRLLGFSAALCISLRYAASVAVFATCWTSRRLAEPPPVLQVGHT